MRARARRLHVNKWRGPRSQRRGKYTGTAQRRGEPTNIDQSILQRESSTITRQDKQQRKIDTKQ